MVVALLASASQASLAVINSALLVNVYCAIVGGGDTVGSAETEGCGEGLGMGSAVGAGVGGIMQQPHAPGPHPSP